MGKVSFISKLMSMKIVKNFITKIENRLKRDYESGIIKINLNVPNNELKHRLNNTLVLCNHDAGGFDFMGISYYMSHVMGIKLNVVANEFFQGKGKRTTFMEDIANKYNIGIIFRKGSRQKIIDKIKDGETVMLFYNPYSWKNMEKNKALTHIIEETNCNPVYIKYNFNINCKKLTEKQIVRESSGVWRYAYKVLKSILSKKKKELLIDLKVSKSFKNRDELVANKEFIRPVVLLEQAANK